MEPAASQVAAHLLQPEDFYLPVNRTIFVSLAGMVSRGEGLDEVTACAALVRDGHPEVDREYVGRLAVLAPAPANVEGYCRIVRECAARRKALAVADDLVKDAGTERPADFIARARERLTDIPGEAEPPPAVDAVESEIEAEIAGSRYSVEWPWHYVDTTKALLPGNICLLCGSPGASKSLWLLDAVLYWHRRQTNVAALELEKGGAFHVRRGLALLEGEGKLTDDRWCRANAAEARAAYVRWRPTLDALSQVVMAPTEADSVDCKYLLRWVEREAAAGRRVLAIDPISMMQGGDKRHLDQERFIHRAQRLMVQYKASLVLVTHPRDAPDRGRTRPALANLQGSKSFERFTDTVLWLESHRTVRKPVETPHGVIEQDFNRTLHLLKVRCAPGAGRRIALHMDHHTLRHTERGMLE